MKRDRENLGFVFVALDMMKELFSYASNLEQEPSYAVPKLNQPEQQNKHSHLFGRIPNRM